MGKESGTRSGLLWQVERILDECNENKSLPQLLLMENVSQVIGVKNIKDFQNWVTKLEKLGYSNFIDILNAKDYGVPQNRQRCFMVSILGEYNYHFPSGYELVNTSKKMLEKEVDEKYFLSKKMIEYISKTGSKNFNNCDAMINKKIMRPITTEQNKRAGTTNYICDSLPDDFDLNEPENTTYGIPIKNATKLGYLIAEDGDGVDVSTRMDTHRGTVQKGMVQTIKTQVDVGVCVKDKKNNLRIRKLTPKECYRLMGFDDIDYERAKEVISENMLYHTAGDSIVVNVLEAIIKEMM